MQHYLVRLKDPSPWRVRLCLNNVPSRLAPFWSSVSRGDGWLSFEEDPRCPVCEAALAESREREAARLIVFIDKADGRDVARLHYRRHAPPSCPVCDVVEVPR